MSMFAAPARIFKATAAESFSFADELVNATAAERAELRAAEAPGAPVWARREALERICHRRLVGLAGAPPEAPPLPTAPPDEDLDEDFGPPESWPDWTDNWHWEPTAADAEAIRDESDWHTTEPTPLDVLDASAPFDPDTPALIFAPADETGRMTLTALRGW